MNRILRSSFVVAAFLALAPATHGQSIVNWGGNYVSTTQDLQGKNSDLNATQAGRGFSTTVPMNPAIGGNYSGTSAQFYGGAVMSQTAHAPVGWNVFAVENQGALDQIHLRVQDNDPLNMHYTMYWDKADFLAPFNSQTIALDTNSRLDLTIHNNNSHMDDAVGRWLVRDGSTFYLSEQTLSFPAAGSQTQSLTFASDAFDGNWAVYTPSGLDIDFNGVTFTAQNFTNITAVGFYVEHDLFTHNNLDWSISGFSFSQVPEPGAFGLTAIALSACLGLRRFRNRTNRSPVHA